MEKTPEAPAWSSRPRRPSWISSRDSEPSIHCCMTSVAASYAWAAKVSGARWKVASKRRANSAWKGWPSAPASPEVNTAPSTCCCPMRTRSGWFQPLVPSRVIPVAPWKASCGAISTMFSCESGTNSTSKSTTGGSGLPSGATSAAASSRSSRALSGGRRLARPSRRSRSAMSSFSSSERKPKPTSLRIASEKSVAEGS